MSERSPRLVAAALVVFGSVVFSNESWAQAPDLVALSVQGPDSAQIGGLSTVNTFIVNLGAPLIGTIDFDVLLSQDLVIDASDIVVQSVSTQFVGALNVPVTIPAQLPPGKYNWALRVDPTVGEQVIFNNQIIGGQTNLFEIDLCLSSSQPVNLSTFKGSKDRVEHVIDVLNCGSGGSIMIFTVMQDPPVPWLSVSPGTSFAVAGGTPQPVTLVFNPQGLDVGVYQTQIRFANFSKPSDFELLPVTLEIGQPSFVPGDTLLGDIGVDEIDEVMFDAVKGMTLNVKLTTTFGNLKPTVDVLDEEGNNMATWKFPSASSKVKKSLKFNKAGTYRLQLQGRKSTIGAYEVVTARKLPKKAMPQKKKVKGGAGGVAETKVIALSGATLDFTVDPTSTFSGPLDIALLAPDGGVLDVSANTQPSATGGLEVVGVVLDQLGTYLIQVNGFGGATETVKLATNPTQPDPGAEIVIVP